jgi:NTP pyrophosphatase (non-canonical NTP hydrolase)
MAKTQRTVGEILELARALRDLGVMRCKLDDIELEFAFVVQPEKPSDFTDPEEHEEAARKIRKKLAEELYEAS